MTLEQTTAPRQQGNGLPPDLEEVALPGRDVRRKRPALLSLLLRIETLRRSSRVFSLLVIDLVGVAAALFTALIVKLALHGNPATGVAWRDARHWLPFSYLITVLMFARVDLYADRPRRPGLSTIAAALFQVTVIALVFALASGQHFSSYYIFYGSLFFGVVYIATLRGGPPCHCRGIAAPGCCR